jgi:hypothetical protein
LSRTGYNWRKPEIYLEEEKLITLPPPDEKRPTFFPITENYGSGMIYSGSG